MIENKVPYRTYADLGKFVRSSFDKIGVAVPPGSRLWQMCELFVDKDGCERRKIKASDPDSQIAIEAGRDLTQLAFVFDTLPSSTLRDFECVLKKTVDDGALPQASPAKSSGRDNQFHLYLAAIAHSAGFTNVRHEEPDVLVDLDEDTCALAAKRIKSAPKLRSRISKASKQIAESKRPGLIAIETSLAFNPTNDRITLQLPEEEFVQRYHSYLQNFIKTNHAKFKSIVDPWWVCGIVFHDQQVRLVGSEWETAGMTICVPFSARCSADPAKFWRKYEMGLPNRVVSPIVTLRRRLWLPAQ